MFLFYKSVFCRWQLDVSPVKLSGFLNGSSGSSCYVVWSKAKILSGSSIFCYYREILGLGWLHLLSRGGAIKQSCSTLGQLWVPNFLKFFLLLPSVGSGPDLVERREELSTSAMCNCSILRLHLRILPVNAGTPLASGWLVLVGLVFYFRLGCSVSSLASGSWSLGDCFVVIPSGWLVANSQVERPDWFLKAPCGQLVRWAVSAQAESTLAGNPLSHAGWGLIRFYSLITTGPVPRNGDTVSQLICILVEIEPN